MMQSGKFKHVVTIQSLVPIQDSDTGVITESWETFADNVRAEVHPSSVKELLEAGLNQSKVTGWVKIRYISGLVQSMRILHRDHVYNIEGVQEDPNSGLEYVTLPISEIQDG